MSARRIAVVGGGYSGTLLAVHLLGRGANVTLIEREDRLSCGVAYSTPHPDHLLNVRASGMSALPDWPDHFTAWLADRNEGSGSSFAERRVYGRYLQSLLDDARADAGGRLSVRHAEALDVTARPGGETVHLAGGERIETDAVVLAPGNLPPGMPRVIASAGLADGVYRADPWAADLAAELGPDDIVLLIGTGLTAIDAALLLDSAGFRGRVLALSRRGLLPRSHADAALGPAELDGAPEPRCIALLRFVRGQAGQIGWRAAVDSLRPFTQDIWKAASLAERRRFLRHLRPWWDVHRHRIAPSIAARIEALEASGRLRVAPGRLTSVSADRGSARIGWRRRGAEAEQVAQVRRIVNCTGPQADISRARDPLLANLLAGGRIRPDACRVGIDVDEQCRALSTTGPQPSLRAVGPVTKGAFWEIVAVPDIRQQVRLIADALTA